MKMTPCHTFLRAVLSCSLALGIVACGGGDGGTGPDSALSPASITSAAAVGPSATVGAPVSVVPAVTVKSGAGAPIGGALVTFSASGGGSVANPTATTDATGKASAGAWTLGTQTGVNSVTASVANLAPVVFTVQSVPDTAITMTALPNNVTAALTGVAVTPAPAVILKDRFGNPALGAFVTFAATAGSGTVIGTATTDGTGIARPASWTMPIAGGTHTMRVTSRSLSTTLSVTAAPPPSQFDIELRFLGDVTPGQRAAFETAVARWRAVITGDLPSATITAAVGVTAGACGIPHPAVVETIEDLVIFVHLTPLDGPGKLLGRAGPCVHRTQAPFANVPILGTMQFDSDDLAVMESGGTLTPVIMHEMGHVLGFGTTWSRFAPSKITGAGGLDPFFTGVQARDYFGRLGGATTNGVPIENCVTGVPPSCGEGTRDAHWRESTFRTELMTGYINGSADGNPLSTVTIASMADLGYSVNLGAADAYVLPPSTGFSLYEMARMTHINEVLLTSRFGVRD